MNIRLFVASLQAMICCILLLLGTVVYFHYSSAAVSQTLPGEATNDATIATRIVQTPDSIPNAGRGAALWKANYCASCHATNMKDDMTAPALAGVTERWSAYPREDLYAWVRQSQKLIGSGHPRAQVLWKQWGPTVMSNYTNLSDYEIEDLLAYIEAVGDGN